MGGYTWHDLPLCVRLWSSAIGMDTDCSLGEAHRRLLDLWECNQQWACSHGLLRRWVHLAGLPDCPPSGPHLLRSSRSCHSLCIFTLEHHVPERGATRQFCNVLAAAFSLLAYRGQEPFVLYNGGFSLFWHF